MILRHRNSKAVLEFFGLHYFRSETNKACRTKCLSRSKAVWESPTFTDKPVSKSQPYLSYLWLSLLHVLICNPEGETLPGCLKEQMKATMYLGYSRTVLLLCAPPRAPVTLQTWLDSDQISLIALYHFSEKLNAQESPESQASPDSWCPTDSSTGG